MKAGLWYPVTMLKTSCIIERMRGKLLKIAYVGLSACLVVVATGQIGSRTHHP